MGDKRQVLWDDDEDQLYWHRRTGGFKKIGLGDLRGALPRARVAGHRRRVITATGYTTVTLPTDCTFVAITTVGGDNGGEGGKTGAASVNGGAGGDSGAAMRVLLLRDLLPDASIYAYVGAGGAGGASGAAGTAGLLSIVEPTNSGFDGLEANIPAWVIAGYVAAQWTRVAHSWYPNTAAATGQAGTITPGNATPWQLGGGGLTEFYFLDGGRAGGGLDGAGTAQAGGGWSAYGGLAARAGGTAGGGAGVAGIYGGGRSGYITASSDPAELVWAYGGTGGGGFKGGTGGAGGNGALGCGGGGGGAGSTGGAGGTGGNGFIIIECW